MSQSKYLVENFLALFAKILVQKMLSYAQVLTTILVCIFVIPTQIIQSQTNSCSQVAHL